MLRTIGLLLLGTLMIGCAHARGRISIGDQGEDGEVRNGFEANYLSRDPEKMVMAASKATVNVMNAETCRIAVANGRPCVMDGFASAPFGYGVGMGMNNGYGAPPGLGSNVAGRLFHGNAFGGAVTPQYVPVVPVQVSVPAQNDALREELATVRRLAERADKKGDAAIDATKKVVTHLSGTPAAKPAAPAIAPPVQAPATGTGAATLPPP